MKNSRSDSRNGSFGRTETSGNNDTNITNNSLTKKKLERSYSPSSRSSSSSSSPVPNPSSSRNSPSTSISQKSSPLSKSSSISKNLPNSSLSHSTSFPQNPDVLFSKQLSSPVLKNVDEFREISNEKPSTSFDQRPSLKGRANSFEFVSKKEADAQKRKMQENNAYQTVKTFLTN